MNGLASRQFVEELDEEVVWDAIALTQFDDRSAYDRWHGDEGVVATMSGFAVTYVHGMKRYVLANFALVQQFLLSPGRAGDHVPAFRAALRAGTPGFRRGSHGRAAHDDARGSSSSAAKPSPSATSSRPGRSRRQRRTRATAAP